MAVNARRKRSRRYARRLTLILDGVDISRRTFYLDRRRGVIRLLSLDANGAYVREREIWSRRHSLEWREVRVRPRARLQVRVAPKK